jgi:hypothetical protein
MLLEEGGIVIDGSSFNTVRENIIADNIVGLIVGNPAIGGLGGNLIYHDNFINNTIQARAAGNNLFDNGYPDGGNYWSDYNGTDQFSGPYQNETGSDGIGDKPYNTSSFFTWLSAAAGRVMYPPQPVKDRYPLMARFKTFNVTSNNMSYDVDVNSNSSITNLNFNATAKALAFNVTGTNGTIGFCRVIIPKALVSNSTNAQWVVTVNGGSPIYLYITPDANYTYIYFTYHHSTETVTITSTNAAPEFQSFMLLFLFIIASLLSVMTHKKERARERARASELSVGRECECAYERGKR